MIIKINTDVCTLYSSCLTSHTDGQIGITAEREKLKLSKMGMQYIRHKLGSHIYENAQMRHYLMS